MIVRRRLVGSIKRAYSTSYIAGPVDVYAFGAVLDGLWQRWGAPRPSKIGLAVSGGVDSMALASLCSELRGIQSGHRQEFEAFIIDHKLRDGSTDEALLVRKLLEDLGLKASVLSLSDEESNDAKTSGNLESTARAARYKLLGQACYKAGISALMTGHHLEDQAETVLSRMCHNWLHKGLGGMKELATIPDVKSYGAWQSGSPAFIKSHLHAAANTSAYTHLGPMAIETGGVKVVRPLLSFRKDALIATCKNNNIEWVEDKTNADPTLTIRNAIRHLQKKSDNLPVALRTERIAEMSRSVQAQYAEIDKIASAAWDKFHLQLDTRTSVLKVSIPKAAVDIIEQSFKPRRAKSNILDRFGNLLGSRNNLDKAILKFLDKHKSTFYAGDYTFMADYNKSSGDFSYTICRNNPDKQRQAAEDVCILPNNKAPNVEGDFAWTDWHLFDNRYWLRVGWYKDGRPPSGEVRYRFYHEDDIATSTDYARRSFKKSLKGANLSLTTHYSIPVITVRNNNKEEVVAMPSLTWSLNSWSYVYLRSMRNNATFFYDIRHKQLPADMLQPTDEDFMRQMKSKEVEVKAAHEALLQPNSKKDSKVVYRPH